MSFKKPLNRTKQKSIWGQYKPGYLPSMIHPWNRHNQQHITQYPPLNSLVCTGYNWPFATYMHCFFPMTYINRQLGSEHFYKQYDTFRICLPPPPPSLPEKGKKNSENIFFFFIIFFFYNFSYSSAASKRAFCLIYPSGAIFCFRCASLAIEIITKWFFRGRLTWEIGWTENRRTPLDIQFL